MSDYIGKTIELIGDTGTGKTTQVGEYAKWVWKTRKLKTLLHTCDRGGYDSILPLVRAGVVKIDALKKEDDPWIWVNRAVEWPADEEVGCEAFDSGTSMGDILLAACHKAQFQVGQQKTQHFKVTQNAQNLDVTIANQAHYGVVQGFMLDAIRRSTWKIERGIDVIWNFVLLRGEGQDRTPILGPKVCGNALTPFLPKEFRLTFRLDMVPEEGGPPRHLLYTTAHPELAGMGFSFGNIRCPLGVEPPKAIIEPASLLVAMEELERAHADADRLVAEQLNLN